jgi:hypothetical protein
LINIVNSKKSRRFQDNPNNERYGGPVYELPPLPPRANMDDLSALQDEELIRRLDTLHEGRGHFLKARTSAQPWEEEICFIKRELQLRRGRRAAHDEYSKQVDVDNRASQRDEKWLPAADLDNSKFMFLS